MEFSNKGGSIYHHLVAIYVRTPEGTILRSIGKESELLHTIWPQIKQRVLSDTSLGDDSDSSLCGVPIEVEGADPFIVNITERTQQQSSNVIGIVLREAGEDQDPSPFLNFFARLVLSQTLLQAPVTVQTLEYDVEEMTQQLTDLFDRDLRFAGHDDQWTAKGRAYFVDRIRHFVSQGTRVDFCLPAFPCKSSNPEKVAGDEPDKGEELALRRLHGFVEEIEKHYPPGARVWIISDGHVFSDCIGVDDDTVDEYGTKLKQMNRAIAEEHNHQDRVWFRSLVDIFDLASDHDSLPSLATSIELADIEHHVDTKHTEEAEICRRILMAGCQPDPAGLRSRIDSQEKSILSLYRGFSRFMLEDLNLHASTKDLSKSKRKKLSASVSFEMIQRNQAYSNLVELILPDHVRLSIHAHNNAGPKFGIQLFDVNQVKAVESLDPDALKASSDDLLHIPTPWHNCVTEVEGSEVLHVVKSKIVTEALEDDTFEGEYVEGKLANGRGGHFKVCNLSEPPSQGETTPQSASPVQDVQSTDSSRPSSSSDRSLMTESGGSETDATSVEQSPSPSKASLMQKQAQQASSGEMAEEIKSRLEKVPISEEKSATDVPVLQGR